MYWCTDQIAAFQGHHTYPYTITARTPANNVHKSISALLPVQVIVSSLAMWPPLSAFLCSFVAFSVLAQETHRQAHMARYVAPWIGHLQNCGLIISSRAHALHHKKGGNYATHYGILSGWANQVLDNGILRLWEAVLYTTFGATPQCWLLDETLKTQAMETLPAWWPKSNK